MIHRLMGWYFSAYRGLNFETWALGIAFFINRAGNLVMPFMSLYLVTQLKMSPAHAAGILMFYGAASILGSFVAGSWCARVHSVQVQAILLGIQSFTIALVPMVHSEWLLIVILSLYGFAFDGVRPASWVALTEVCPKKDLQRGFALNRTFINLGWALGPSFGGFIALESYDYLFIGNSVLSLIAMGTLLWFFRGKTMKPKHDATSAFEKKDTYWKVMGDKEFLLVQALTTLLILCFFQLFSTFPIYAKNQLGFDEGDLGILFAVNPILIILAEVILIQYASKFQTLKIMSLGAAIIGAAYLGIATVHGFWAMVGWVVFLTAGEILVFPMASSYVSERAPPHLMGYYMGIHSGVISVGMVLAPILGLQLVEHHPNWIWLGVTLLGALTAGIFYGIANRKSKQSLSALA